MWHVHVGTYFKGTGKYWKIIFFSFVALLANGASSDEATVEISFCSCVSGQGECQFDELEDGYDESMTFKKVVCECGEQYSGAYSS